MSLPLSLCQISTLVLYLILHQPFSHPTKATFKKEKEITMLTGHSFKSVPINLIGFNAT